MATARGGPNGINVAGSIASAYGTYGQGGNVYEWMESAYDGVNNSFSELRGARGGGWANTEGNLRSSYRSRINPPSEFSVLGFRVASIEVIPEPTTFTLLTLGSLALVMGRWRR